MHARHFILVALLLLAATPAPAQTFPTHPVTIISPYQAGGTSDIIARALAQMLAEAWLQPVVVENRPAPMVQSACRRSPARQLTATCCLRSLRAP
jgi:tripartite-type tricarboxylate transporter receptor subunit TctC